MITQAANIINLPYRDLKKIDDLLVFERTYLSLFTNEKSQYFLLYLCDQNEDYDEYLFWKVELIDLYAFLNKRISLKDIIIAPTKEFIFKVYSDVSVLNDVNNSQNFLKIEQTLVDEIEADLLPDVNSFWKYGISDKLSSLLDKFSRENYLEVLRENSVYFILQPKGLSNSTTVSAGDVSDFLYLLIRSYLSYAVYQFVKQFPELIGDNLNYPNSDQELKARLMPRVSDNKYGSFEIGLGVDSLHPIFGADETVFNWQKKLLEDYKAFTFDTALSDSIISDSLQSIPLDIRKNIFNPLFTIANNKRYSVKVTNRLKTRSEQLLPVPKEIRKLIIQTDEEQPAIEEAPVYEFINLTLLAPAGSEPSDLGKRILRKNTITLSRSDTAEYYFESSFGHKTFYFTIINPLPVRQSIRGNLHVLYCSVFDISVETENEQLISSEFEDEIYNYYFTNVLNNPRSTQAKIFELYFSVKDLKHS